MPALVIDGQVLTENLAIINLLNASYPHAGILPTVDSELERARQLADLNFCSSTLHPLVTRIRIPHFFAKAEAARSVWALGCEGLKDYCQLIDERLRYNEWWYGEQWSAMDAYLFWVLGRVEDAGFAVEDYPSYLALCRRMQQRPAVKRALAREQRDLDLLQSEGMLPPQRSYPPGDP